MKKIHFFLIACLLTTFASHAQKEAADEVQVREIPEAVKQAFSKQYADAEHIAYKDNLLNVLVYFTEDDTKMVARYDNKGNWKETGKEWSFDKLAPEIKDGFSKSKYANPDWKIEETSIISTPDEEDTYRIKVGKNDIQKKYLYFNKSGRLIRDAITI